MEGEPPQHGRLTWHLSLFQGSKGDPGLTGPMGAAGLPVSLQGREVALCTPLAATRSKIKTHSPEPGAHIQG